MASAERDLVGSVVLTRYRVIAKAASGATADIYEAEHVTSKSRVALKVLANNDASSDVAARFLREGKTLGMFRHPSIVELLEVGRLEDGRLFLATEMVRGSSLRQLLARGAIEPRRALSITREVLDALGHAHGMGIIHRGMRPETVMVTDAGVKVLDFGVAKLATDTAAVMGENKLTRTGIAVLGDPRYSAPEVARGGDTDARADLYAVGMMLKELLGAAATKTPELQLLIADSTQMNRDKRYPSAAQMRDGVDQAIASLDELDVMAADDRAARAAAPIAPSSGAVAEPMAAASSTSEGWSLDSQPVLAAPPQVSPPDAMGAPPARPSASFLPGVTERPSKPSVPPIAPIADPPSAPYVGSTPPQTVSADPLFTATPQVPTAPVTHTGPWHGSASLTASEASRSPSSWAGPKGKRSFADLVAVAKKHRVIVGGVLGALVLVIVLVALFSGGSSKKKVTPGQDGKALLARGRAELEAGHRADAVSLYERAIAADSGLAKSDDIRHDAQAIVESKDAVAAVLALELLASRVSPPAKDVILATAAAGKNGDVRRRALAIAERDGFADEIDRVASLSLDLTQATTCDDRRAVIAKLRATADKRAVAPLKKAKVYKCVERDATDAIAELEAQP
ncbi:MAG TPA: protein kinase [Kofleriaceae bacterium]|nr:protein kinase [Kofleriaceae bacterium]